MDKYDKRLGAAASVIFFSLLSGTVLFHWLEGWRYFEAFYFTGMTVTTVGYGDLAPTTDAARLLAVVYAFLGIGVVFYSIGIFAQRYFEREEHRLVRIWERTRNPPLLGGIVKGMTKGVAEGVTKGVSLGAKGVSYGMGHVAKQFSKEEKKERYVPIERLARFKR